LREGARFRADILTIAIRLIVGEGFQENFNTFATMFEAWKTADKFNFDELLNWD